MSDLFDDEGDAEGVPSPFLEELEAARGGRIGRPKGALNRKTRDFEAWYTAMGFKDPAELLAQVVSADPLALAAVMPGKSRLDALKLQVAAAGELMPYLHGKMPTRTSQPDERLPMLVINAATNQLAQGRRLAEGKQLAIGRPAEPEASEINGLDDGGAEASHGDASHGGGK